MIKTVELTKEGFVRLIDQRLLPTEEVVVECVDYLQVAEAIRNMTVRGAPAIGVAAAGGVALGARAVGTADVEKFNAAFDEICRVMASTRPTAVNLFWAVGRMRKAVMDAGLKTVAEMKKRAADEAAEILKEDLLINETMGRNGARLIGDGDAILTHCNAGALATAGHFGTALGVIKAAHLEGKRVTVFADETRPFLQGARLTAWELKKEGIDVTLITDSMAGYCMKKGLVQKVIVGADRIAKNGDAANKIGTYPLAVLARTHGIPFYVAAPLSTIDFNIPNGDHIPIEERDETEVSHIGGRRLAPEGVKIFNPAFDVTPNEYISAIITEKGIAERPFEHSLEKLRQA